MSNLNNVQRLALQRKNANYPKGINIEAVYGLIERVFGKAYVERFVIEQRLSDGFDCYRLEDVTVDGKPKIRLSASSGTAAAAPLRWYLQERCDSYIGPLTRRLNLPTEPPKIGEPIQNESPFLYRYFLNYCTFSYSLAFWTWKEWEPFLDWLLLSGYNLVLNTVGNEQVWSNALVRMGYTLEEARKNLSAPAFFSWQCAMNITGWCGAAPEAFYDGRVELSKKITARLNELGANVVLPAYAGMVPPDFKDHYPDADLADNQGLWCGFPRPAFVQPTDPLFARFAQTYYEEQQKLFGNCTAYFGAIPFNEGGRSERVNLTTYARRCHEEMQRVQPTAVWVIEGWGDNPKREILNALPTDDLLVINLRSEICVDGDDNFADRPWVFGTVNNFGGLRLFRAKLNWQYQSPHHTLSNERNGMVGIGMLPEGIETDECCFDLFSDIAFLKQLPRVEEWQTNYLRHRYGVCTPALERAWTALRRDVYLSDTGVAPLGSPLCSQPSLTVTMYTPYAGNDKHTYHPNCLIPIARDLLLEKARLSDCVQYRTDLAEVLRQLVALSGWGVVKQLQQAFRNRDVSEFEKAAADLMKLFEYQCAVMADNPVPTLQDRLEMATRHGKTDAEKLYYAFQVKTQMTTWGGRNTYDELHDYSNREWSGMLEYFYRPRWERYLNYLRLELMSPRANVDVDGDYPQFDTDRAFCLSDLPSENFTPARDFVYADELLAFCEQLLAEQIIEVSLEMQEHSMEVR